MDPSPRPIRPGASVLASRDGLEATGIREFELRTDASLYVGAGIGVDFLDIDGTSKVFSSEDRSIDIAWNVGIGLNYALTDEATFGRQCNPFRVTIRIEVFEFRSARHERPLMASGHAS